MPGERIYLDYNATAPLAPGVREIVCAALELVGNASSVHREGRSAHGAIESAREQVAALVGVSPRRVTFTSGATEAANLALTPCITGPGLAGLDVLILAAGEHPCVLEGHRFASDRVLHAPLTTDGALDLDALRSLLEQAGEARCALALQAANNETGVIQPVRDAAELMHGRGGIVICDAVQGAHRIDCSAETLGADVLFFSSHKMGGPKGAGALVIANAALEIGAPMLKGGGQERGLRAGTENIAAIAGFGAAAAHSLRVRDDEALRQRQLRDAFEAGLKARWPGVTIFGAGSPRLPNTSAFAIEGLTAETLLIALDLQGLALSSGAACSSGKVRSSHVLESMMVAPDLARGALRMSLGEATTADEVVRALEAIGTVVEKMMARRVRSAA